MNKTSEALEPNLVHEDSPIERKFFVANLGYDIGESDLYSFFSTYGKVEQVRLIVDRITGSSRGFGFITMADEVGALSVADLAEESNNTVTMMGRPGVHIAVHDRERQIKKAEERRQMFGGGGGFGPYGGGDGSFMPPYHLNHHHNHPSNHPGIGMPPSAPYGGFQPSISMPPHHARTQMPPPPPLSSSYAPVPPAWHKMRVSIGGGAGGPPFELLVEDLPNNISIDDLVTKFSSYGTVVGASMRQSIGDAGSGRLSYGRVLFSNPTSLASIIFRRRKKVRNEKCDSHTLTVRLRQLRLKICQSLADRATARQRSQVGRIIRAAVHANVVVVPS